MGIWQIFALSSVLQQDIVCVYSKLENINDRQDLHRLIHTRIKQITPIIQHIMWTSTRKDMKGTHWVPNHFVLVISIENRQRATNEPNLFHGTHSNLHNIYLKLWS